MDYEVLGKDVVAAMNDRIALVVMDGVGIGDGDKGDMVWKASTPTLDRLLAEYPHCQLKAHGTAVGLPTDDDMGNSEVGHNALGCGQIYSQGARLVNESIENGSVFESNAWREILANCIVSNSKLHFIGLLSDGNVHSNISHLIAMLREAKDNGIEKCCIHILLDGRDVSAQSALQYVDALETGLQDLNNENFFGCIASGGGRMSITMDCCQADWDMVKRGWDTHVRGIGRQFADARTAIETYRAEGCVSDQCFPAFVIAKDGKPVGTIEDQDSVILFNFRGDRAIELSMAFEMEDFPYFDRGEKRDVVFAGMLQYDGDLKLPRRYLAAPPQIRHTLTEVLTERRIAEYAVSETQKYGHVTYFWNGNRSGKISEEYETYQEIPSDKVPFEQRPWMKAGEIADAFIEAIESGKYGFMRCNFANGDMVGHTGNLLATQIAVECVDLQLGRILEACQRTHTTLLVTADHGNADKMLDFSEKGEEITRTAHSLNPVPFVIVSPDRKVRIRKGNFGLANVAPTILGLMGIPAPDCWEESMLVGDEEELTRDAAQAGDGMRMGESVPVKDGRPGGSTRSGPGKRPAHGVRARKKSAKADREKQVGNETQTAQSGASDSNGRADHPSGSGHGGHRKGRGGREGKRSD